MHIRSLATIGLIFLIGSQSSAQDSYALKPHWELGQKLQYNTSIDMEMKLKALGDEVQKNELQLDSEWVTLPKDNGAQRQVQHEITRVLGKVNLYGQVLNFDSENAAESPPILQQLFGGVIGRKHTWIYDDQDRFIDIQGDGQDEAPPLGQGSGLSFKELADQTRLMGELAVPPQSVAVGATWPLKQKVPMAAFGTMEATGEGKLVEIVEVDGDKYAKVHLLLKLALSPADSNHAPMVTLHGESSSLTAEVLFRLSDRVQYETSSRLKLFLDFTGNAAQIDQTTTHRLVKKSAVSQ